MIGISEWMLLGAGLTIGGGLGVIAGGLVAGGSKAALREDLDNAWALVDDWKNEWFLAATKAIELKKQIDRRNAPLLRQAAALKAKRLEKQAQERLIKQARTAELRRLVGEII